MRSVVRRARRLRAHTVVCWDLDNTLVDSGALIRAGTPVLGAWVEADPVPGMLEFASALADSLPEAVHVVLSVRTRSVRSATIEWLARHRVTTVSADDVWFVATPAAKTDVWRVLAETSRLVVVDDLGYGHELPEPLVDHRLVAEARRIADAYVGLEEIERVRADPLRAVDAARDLAGRVRALEPRGGRRPLPGGSKPRTGG